MSHALVRALSNRLAIVVLMIAAVVWHVESDAAQLTLSWTDNSTNGGWLQNSAEVRFDGNVCGNCNSRPKRRLLHRFRARLCDDLLLTTQGLEWWGVLRDGLVQRADVRSDHGHRHVRRADLGIDGEQGGDGWRDGDEYAGGDFVRGELLGELSERERGDADRGTRYRIQLHGLEWRRLLGDRLVHGDDGGRDHGHRHLWRSGVG